MAVQRIVDMTLDDLKALIDQRIHEVFKPQDNRTVEEILESIDRNMWTPPPGAKSSLELLREDRDS
jgi:hypothetical protein